MQRLEVSGAVRLIYASLGVKRLKAKTVAKLNSTEMDFRLRSARISWKDKIRNNTIKQKKNVTRSLLEDIKTKQLKWYGHLQRMEEGSLPKKL